MYVRMKKHMYTRIYICVCVAQCTFFTVISGFPSDADSDVFFSFLQM